MQEGKKKRKIIRVDKENSSGLSAFIERPVPSEQEVSNFEKVVGREVRHQEIDSNLTEIYSDKKGELVDVSRVSKKHGSAMIVKVFRRLLMLTIISLAAYFSYLHFFTGGNDMSTVKFIIIAPEKVVVGEEFSYQIEYENPTKFAMSNINLELKYPENFVFISANPAPASGQNGFSLVNLPAGAKEIVEIRGFLIASQDSVQVISGRLSYVPLNFSSEFKKEASDATIISEIGFSVSAEVSDSSFIGQDNEINLSFFDINENYLKDFLIKFSLPESATLRLEEEVQASSSENINPVITSEGSRTWLLSNLVSTTTSKQFKFFYQLKEDSGEAEIKIQLQKRLSDGQTYTFWEKIYTPETIKSDLNLSLFFKGSKNNQSASFGETLNFTLNYSNKGINTFKDAVVMAVLDGFLYDWDTITLDKDGEIRSGKSITWTKNDLLQLAEIEPGDEGEINFSISLKNYQDSFFGQELEVSAYAQYGAGGQDPQESKNNSNTIVIKLNSDLSLQENIRYFDDNNAPVGSGPLPPRVGETSSFRVYWKATNNIHELTQTEVLLNLPSYVTFVGGANVSVGNLYYDESRQAVVWQIGRLPVSVYEVDASFLISITPIETDRNKILVLSPGAIISAVDNETQATISAKSGPKTTKLEDDDIASLNNSGRIE